MKTIYTVINEKVYKIDQQTNIPLDMEIPSVKPGVYSIMNVDPRSQLMSNVININTLSSAGVKSNKECYNEMLQFLKDKKITEIPTITNMFKVYIDYSIFDNGKEIEHSTIFKPVEAIDKVLPLGVGTNNECVYRRVKTFKALISFKTKNTLPYGIMGNCKKNCVLKIHNIALFEDLAVPQDIHNSIYETSFCGCAKGPQNSQVASSAFCNMEQMYSTANDGYEIQDAEINFMPRNIYLTVNMVLASPIVAYSEADVQAILAKNIEDKYKPGEDPDTPTTPDEPDPGPIIPEPDKKPDADGDETPDKNGYYNWYERAKETNPKALLVVEDEISDALYDVSVMIRKNKVIKDIPDITVGEYVIYREALMTENL